MSDKIVNYSFGGMSLPMILFILFFILKVTNVIDWSWVWVTAPLWISIFAGISCLAIIGLIALFIILCLR